MIKIVRLPALVLIAAAFAIPSASALTAKQVRECNAMGQKLQKEQKSVLSLQADLEALAEDTDAAGEAWEDAETLRLFSTDNAIAADTLKAEFDALKADFAAVENELFVANNAFNQNVNAYNRKCTK